LTNVGVVGLLGDVGVYVWWLYPFAAFDEPEAPETARLTLLPDLFLPPIGNIEPLSLDFPRSFDFSLSFDFSRSFEDGAAEVEAERENEKGFRKDRMEGSVLRSEFDLVIFVAAGGDITGLEPEDNFGGIGQGAGAGGVATVGDGAVRVVAGGAPGTRVGIERLWLAPVSCVILDIPSNIPSRPSHSSSSSSSPSPLAIGKICPLLALLGVSLPPPGPGPRPSVKLDKSPIPTAPALRLVCRLTFPALTEALQLDALAIESNLALDVPPLVAAPLPFSKVGVTSPLASNSPWICPAETDALAGCSCPKYPFEFDAAIPILAALSRSRARRILSRARRGPIRPCGGMRFGSDWEAGNGELLCGVAGVMAARVVEFEPGIYGTPGIHEKWGDVPGVPE
jgi:hypothetical protein